MIDPGRDRLAVIDMQRIFADPASPWASPAFPDIVDPVRRLAEAFGERSVFTRFVAPAAPSGAWREYYAAWPFALQPPDAPDYQLVDEFTAAAGATMDAPTFGKWTPALAGMLGPGERLVVCGVSTDCCVLSTVLAAADAGVEVVVVADACAGLDETSHRRALDAMALYAPLVRVVTMSQVNPTLAAGG